MCRKFPSQMGCFFALSTCTFSLCIAYTLHTPHVTPQFGCWCILLYKMSVVQWHCVIIVAVPIPFQITRPTHYPYIFEAKTCRITTSIGNIFIIYIYMYIYFMDEWDETNMVKSILYIIWAKQNLVSNNVAENVHIYIYMSIWRCPFMHQGKRKLQSNEENTIIITIIWSMYM